MSWHTDEIEKLEEQLAQKDAEIERLKGELEDAIQHERTYRLQFLDSCEDIKKLRNLVEQAKPYVEASYFEYDNIKDQWMKEVEEVLK